MLPSLDFDSGGYRRCLGHLSGRERVDVQFRIISLRVSRAILDVKGKKWGFDLHWVRSALEASHLLPVTDNFQTGRDSSLFHSFDPLNLHVKLYGGVLLTASFSVTPLSFGHPCLFQKIGIERCNRSRLMYTTCFSSFKVRIDRRQTDRHTNLWIISSLQRAHLGLSFTRARSPFFICGCLWKPECGCTTYLPTRQDHPSTGSVSKGHDRVSSPSIPYTIR